MAMQTVKTPFTNMSYTPDVPSSQLGANEYNAGQNIETNVRGINSVAGDQYVLSQIPGNQIFVTSGFDINGTYWYIVATVQGKWYAINTAGFTDITPSTGTFSGYSVTTVITASWNGSVVFLNDEINPPMYFSPGQWSQIRLYDNAPDNYVWNYDVGTDSGGNTVPLYSSLTSAFIRVYNSPNLGSLLVAGNLTGIFAANVTQGTPGTYQYLPTSIRWSQNFGLNSGPTTWAPTVTNVANQVELPVRGPVIDGFPLNGNFYICSYWDTCLMSPIAYQSSYAPVFGIKLVNQGRGMLNENCWVNVDNTVFGLDARDIWQFDGGNFKAVGNQRVKNYFYTNLNPSYNNQVFMVHNSSKYQIEIYYPDLTSTGRCNQMLAYRYDLDAWQPPRQVNAATQATESPIITNGNTINLATRGVVYSTYSNVATTANTSLIQKDQGTSFIGNTAINSLFQRNNISYGQPYSASVLVHRVLPEVYGTGNVTVTIGGADSVANAVVYNANVSMPIQTSDPWVQIDQNEARVVTMQVGSNSAINSWQMTAANWQVTVVQDTR
jgi:hypothetical protein